MRSYETPFSCPLIAHPLQVSCPPSPVLALNASGWFSPSALPLAAPLLGAVSNGSRLVIQPRGTFGFPVRSQAARHCRGALDIASRALADAAVILRHHPPSVVALPCRRS